MASAAASQPVVFGCPLTGQVEPVSHCPDPTFAREILGPGVCIQPEDCVLYAPADAQVEFLLSTKHALGLSTPQRIKFLIHLGLDTNRLEGEGLEAFVQTGDFVRRGDKLLAYNPAVMEKAHCSMNTPFVFCNTQEGWRVELLRTGLVSAGEDLVQLVALQPVKAAPRVCPRESLVLPVGNKPPEGSCIFTGMPGFCRNRGLHTA